MFFFVKKVFFGDKKFVGLYCVLLFVTAENPQAPSPSFLWWKYNKVTPWFSVSNGKFFKLIFHLKYILFLTKLFHGWLQPSRELYTIILKAKLLSETVFFGFFAWLLCSIWFSPWIWEWPYIKMLIWYFSNNLDIYDYIRKLPEQHFSVSLVEI